MHRRLTLQELDQVMAIESAIYTHPWTRGNFADSLLADRGRRDLHARVAEFLDRVVTKFVNDLMRLNKSFIVRRSLKGRELLKSSKQLSAYIHHLVGMQRNVWIAQREGRAKDGVDRTDTALLKMLAMSRREEGVQAALSALHIVPVSISYEFDPCDTLKANELYQKKELGTFQKDEQSDINSIVTGMIGFKGHVHVSFGREIQIDSNDTVEDVAEQIDRQIINNYMLHASNYASLDCLQESMPELVPALESLPLKDAGRMEEARAAFMSRLATVDGKIKPWFLQMYANPVISRDAQGVRARRPGTRRSARMACSDSLVDRSMSVSSIRRMKVPPWPRANSQLNSAVRALPTCKWPVGDGAKRTLIGGI